MKPMIEIFIIVILLSSGRAYGINDSLEYGIVHSAFSPNSINSSNSFNYSDWHGIGQENIAFRGFRITMH